MARSPVSTRMRWAYGIGEMAVVAPVSVAVFFLLFFLTEVVGLTPGQAGGILLLGRLWDASGAAANALAQPASALLVIRWIMGPLPALTIVGGILCAVCYPLTRQQHDSIVLRLAQQEDAIRPRE